MPQFRVGVYVIAPQGVPTERGTKRRGSPIHRVQPSNVSKPNG